MGTGSFQGVTRPGRGIDNPPPPSAEVKERVEPYLYSNRWAFMACSRVNFTFTFNFIHFCCFFFFLFLVVHDDPHIFIVTFTSH
jgi:hypothetical protein